MKNCSFKDRIILQIVDLIFYISLCFLLLFVVMALIDIVCFVCNISKTEEVLFAIEKILDVGYLIMSQIGWSVFSLFKDFLFKNGSLAKKAMKVKVIDAQTGEKPSKKKLILRNIFYITPLTTVVNLAFCFKRLDNLSLGDLITKTRVVYIQEETDDGSVSPK